MSTLYHLVPLCEWDECKQSRQSYFPPTFHQVSAPGLWCVKRPFGASGTPY